ncbi:hypothetical protein P4O66_007258, partial [Electrophorus voltai]
MVFSEVPNFSEPNPEVLAQISQNNQGNKPVSSFYIWWSKQMFRVTQLPFRKLHQDLQVRGGGSETFIQDLKA